MKKLLSIILASCILAVFFYIAAWNSDSLSLYNKIKTTALIAFCQLLWSLVVYAITVIKDK